ncbi:PAQR family membrane homeostasis protein TrhA [Thalassoglobus sp.]|uniref:PAQR family membrane homeostasis protein TrhA n=1 Tax=Thalassoglobus sp. TaxID=2795869 RepID=UPI003AA7E559
MKQYSRGEFRPEGEYANLTTHGVGLVLSMIGAGVLLKTLDERHSPDLRLACSIYCFSLVGLYAASTLSHAFYDIERRRFFRTVDQAFIFILIAGSFTPFAYVYGPSGWTSPIMIIEWSITFAGILMCLYFRNLPSRLKLIYGIQGWLPAFTLKPVFEIGSAEMVVLLVAGGLFYSFGALFLVFDHKVKYFHACWHLSVLMGSTCHFFAVMDLVRNQ